MQPVRPLPHAPAGLSGLIAWRGHCLPVIDLSQRLTGIPSTASSSQRLLIVGPQSGAALGGMIVPGVRGLATIAGSPETQPPALPDTIDPGLLRAWTRHGEDPVAILDPATLFS
jgi:chemotaxis signal transduction protein